MDKPFPTFDYMGCPISYTIDADAFTYHHPIRPVVFLAEFAESVFPDPTMLRRLREFRRDTIEYWAEHERQRKRKGVEW